jgi:hypothetical protein
VAYLQSLIEEQGWVCCFFTCVASNLLWCFLGGCMLSWPSGNWLKCCPATWSINLWWLWFWVGLKNLKDFWNWISIISYQ